MKIKDPIGMWRVLQKDIDDLREEQVNALEQVMKDGTIVVLEKGRMMPTQVQIISVSGSRVRVRRRDNGKEYWVYAYYLMSREEHQ